jgi:pyruvate dehydrogenase E2 component (dihydrolipoamide acetyltransferase)
VARGAADAAGGPQAQRPVEPRYDFAKFGPVEVQPLPRIRRISAVNLARNWATIPHVTNHHEADVTELEAFRKQVNAEAGPDGTKPTLLAFVIRALAAALRVHPEFNASLDGEQLVLKRYAHVGFAVDTAGGLVVPVIRDADRKGVREIAQEATVLAEGARMGRLKAEEMQGGCITVSSLGAHGGAHFTPIINAPEVAVLGLSATTTRPVWNGTGFVPRLMLPLSLSWDHRALDGAAAARFNHFMVTVLGDFRRLLL